MVKKLLPHIVLFAIAILLTFATTYRRVEVRSKADLSALSCGWPFAFVVSDQSWRDPPYPWKASCLEAGWDDKFTFLWPKFAANVAFFYLFGMALLSGYSALRKRSQQ
jgi:hypothetical protein